MSKSTTIDFYEYSPKDMCVYIKKVRLNKELTAEEQTILSLRNALALQEYSKNHFIKVVEDE